MHLINIGRLNTTEQKLKNSIANKGCNNGFFGKRHSQETTKMLVENLEKHRKYKKENLIGRNKFTFIDPDGNVYYIVDGFENFIKENKLTSFKKYYYDCKSLEEQYFKGWIITRIQ